LVDSWLWKRQRRTAFRLIKPTDDMKLLWFLFVALVVVAEESFLGLPKLKAGKSGEIEYIVAPTHGKVAEYSVKVGDKVGQRDQCNIL
jgi:hypothetical protein